MKKYLLAITQDDTTQTFTTIDCDTRKVVHSHSSGYCWDEEEEREQIEIATWWDGSYVTIRL